MTNFNDFLNEQMKDPEFKAEWDALDPEAALGAHGYCTDRHQQAGTWKRESVASHPTAACSRNGNES